MDRVGAGEVQTVGCCILEAVKHLLKDAEKVRIVIEVDKKPILRIDRSEGYARPQRMP